MCTPCTVLPTEKLHVHYTTRRSCCTFLVKPHRIIRCVPYACVFKSHSQCSSILYCPFSPTERERGELLRIWHNEHQRSFVLKIAFLASKEETPGWSSARQTGKGDYGEFPTPPFRERGSSYLGFVRHCW